MKRLFIILAFVGSSVFSTANAAGNKTSPVVLQSFQTSFSGAKEIIWKQVGVLYKANFVWNDEYHSAFYNSDGDLVAVTKNISSQQLPKALQMSLKKQREGFWISEAFVISTEGRETYYVKLENKDTTVALKSSGSKKWTIYQKTEK